MTRSTGTAGRKVLRALDEKDGVMTRERLIDKSFGLIDRYPTEGMRVSIGRTIRTLKLKGYIEQIETHPLTFALTDAGRQYIRDWDAADD